MLTAANETIILSNIEGISRKSGTDEHGNTWTEFEVDYLAEQEPGECSICSATELESGWLCLDGGEEVCDEHVVFAEDLAAVSYCLTPPRERHQ